MDNSDIISVPPLLGRLKNEIKNLVRFKKRTAALTIIMTTVASFSGISVYAILYSVSIFDTLVITEEVENSNRRTSDSLPLSEDTENSNRRTSDVLPLTEGFSPGKSVRDNHALTENVENNNRIIQDSTQISDDTFVESSMRDTLPLSESADVTTTIFHDVAVTSTVGIAERLLSDIAARDMHSLSESSVNDNKIVLDTMEISDEVTNDNIIVSDIVEIVDEGISIAATVIDILTMTTSVLVTFILDISESLVISDAIEGEDISSPVQEEDEHSSNRNAVPSATVDDSLVIDYDPIVYDERYFLNSPLKRMSIIELATFSSEGRTTTLAPGDTIRFDAVVGNFQMADQNYVFIVQILDEDGVTVDVLPSTALIGSGKYHLLSQNWNSEGVETGKYKVMIMMWDRIESMPSALSEKVDGEIEIVSAG